MATHALLSVAGSDKENTILYWDDTDKTLTVTEVDSDGTTETVSTAAFTLVV